MLTAFDYVAFFGQINIHPIVVYDSFQVSGIKASGLECSENPYKK